jgi:hypothetical protein
MRGWGCQKSSMRECDYNSAIQRKCAQRLTVQMGTVAESGDGATATSGARDESIPLVLTMGEMGGSCKQATTLLQRKLEQVLSTAPGESERGDGSATLASLPPPMRAITGVLRRIGSAKIAPRCVSYCRPTHHLECRSQSYQEAVRSAVVDSESEIKLGGANSSLAVLTFVYAASLEMEMTDTLVRWGPQSYGHGADLIVIGATWASVMRTAKPKLGQGKSTDLAWSGALTSAWHGALAACSAVARCILRTVPENLKQPAKQPYEHFRERVQQIGKQAGTAVVDNFAGTWTGVRAGLMAHHDSTRIHFSDTGRAYLAQLTLNALALLLPPTPRQPAANSEGGAVPLADGKAGSAATGLRELGVIRLERLVPHKVS